MSIFESNEKDKRQSFWKILETFKKSQNFESLKMFLMDDVRVQIIIQVLICFQINKFDITRQLLRPRLSHK